MAERIQLSRQRGWRKPEQTVVVARPGQWGNPFHLGAWDPEYLALNDHVAAADPCSHVDTNERAVTLFARYQLPGLDLEPLHGRDLGCWCRPDRACHADVLLAAANGLALPDWLRVGRDVVAVTGSRRHTGRALIEARLSVLLAEAAAGGDALVVIEGGATGADSIAGDWAQRTPGAERLRANAAWRYCGPECPPDGSHRRKRSGDATTYCPQAGPRRNQRMVDRGGAGRVEAFPLPGSRGTWDMVRRAEAAGLPVAVDGRDRRADGWAR